MSKKLLLKVYTNNDDATIVIIPGPVIKNCRGFAIYRKAKGQTDLQAEAIPTGVGFQGDAHPEGEMRPSTEWPIQKFIWTDYFVRQGDEVAYKVVPMVFESGILSGDLERASDWSDWFKIGNTGDAQVFFNRGLVSSQFVARRMLTIPPAEQVKKLKTLLADPGSEIRTFMGGDLAAQILRMLEGVLTDKTLKIYLALYELEEIELIKKLNAIGKRAYVILANGAFGEELDPQAETAALLTKVNLTRRIVETPHFAHNKFAVITRTGGDGIEHPIEVFTGSTNWTPNGLFTQVNNGLVLCDQMVAAYYLQQWQVMLADCVNGKGTYGKAFREFNSSVKSNLDGSIQTYFTPVPKLIDMEAANALIRGAKQGILFLMFKPGVEGKSLMLYDTILEMAAKGDLLVNGVMNNDPGGTANPTITFLHKNTEQKASLDVVLPGSIDTAFESWMREMSKKNVTIHSKTIVIDPFSDDPIIIVGSHNMGSKASKSNDDNLNIIRGNKKLAEAYALHMSAVYHHYRWRFYRAKNTGLPKWSGNVKSDEWQDWYTKGDKLKEIRFWSPKKLQLEVMELSALKFQADFPVSMSNGVKMQKLIAAYGPIPYPDINLGKTIKNIYVDEALKDNLADDVCSAWPDLVNCTELHNLLFASLKTGKSILSKYGIDAGGAYGA